MVRCQATTKAGKPCPNGGATIDPQNGQWRCHVHNSAETFQRQLEAQREGRRRQAKSCLAALNVKKARAPWPPADTAPLKDRH